MSFAHAPTVPRQPRPRTHSQFAVPKQTKPHGNPKKKKHADDGDNAHFFAAHHKTEAASPEKQDQATSSPEKNQTTSSPEKPSSSSPEPPASSCLPPVAADMPRIADAIIITTWAAKERFNVAST